MRTPAAPSNEIAFPAGILQSPYFSKDWPEYMAFGAFGSVAGHELSHAFDQMGRQYNKDGKLVDWWTNVRSLSLRSVLVADVTSAGYRRSLRRAPRLPPRSVRRLLRP